MVSCSMVTKQNCRIWMVFSSEGVVWPSLQQLYFGYKYCISQSMVNIRASKTWGDTQEAEEIFLKYLPSLLLIIFDMVSPPKYYLVPNLTFSLTKSDLLIVVLEERYKLQSGREPKPTNLEGSENSWVERCHLEATYAVRVLRPRTDWGLAWSICFGPFPQDLFIF